MIFCVLSASAQNIESVQYKNTAVILLPAILFFLAGILFVASLYVPQPNTALFLVFLFLSASANNIGCVGKNTISSTWFKMDEQFFVISILGVSQLAGSTFLNIFSSSNSLI